MDKNQFFVSWPLLHFDPVNLWNAPVVKPLAHLETTATTDNNKRDVKRQNIHQLINMRKKG